MSIQKKIFNSPRHILRFFYRITIKLIPKNRFGDKIFALMHFIISHKRLPSNKLIFNNVLYQIKTTDEILNPLRVFVSDKEFVKIFIRAMVGNKYNVPTFRVLKSTKEIDNYKFPPNCCIKATHGNGWTILRKNSQSIDLKKIKNWLSLNYYKSGREANYKYLSPKIIVEPLVFGSANPNDYKFFCVNGIPKLIQVDIDRYTNHKRTLLDINWNILEYSIAFQNSKQPPKKPNNYKEMITIAKKLSSLFSFVRIDMYSNGKICYVGEITNCHGGASEKFIPLIGEIKASKLLFKAK